MKKLLTFLVMGAVVSFVLLFCGAPVQCAIPHMINYQGMLTDDLGDPVTDTLDLEFKIYNAESNGTLKWSETQTDVPIIDGLFNVILGSVNLIDTLSFAETYWLEIKVGAQTMPNRLRFTSVGYAYRAEKADTADYALSSSSGPGGYTWTFRITDTADTTISTGGNWGIARYGNTLYGNADSTHVNLGVACTTGTSGQNYKYCTVGGGRGNTASGRYATVGGGTYNTASEYSATVGGGYLNTADTNYTTVGGGYDNTASGFYATVGGGYLNTASEWYATVAGGNRNTASGAYSFAAGSRAKANHTGAFVWADATNANFASTDTNQFLIRASGGVGIGTNSPEEMLHVQNATEGVIKVGTPTTNGNATIIFEEGNTDALALRYNGSANELRIDDETTANTRMVIERSGNVGIGTTSPGSYKLAVSGSAAKTGGGSWSVFSDLRLKEVKTPYKYGLSEINRLQPVHYCYKEDNALGLPAGKEYVGLVAQDVERVIPDAIEKNDQGYLMLNNDPIIWAMLNAIKELNAENEELKKRIQALESK